MPSVEIPVECRQTTTSLIAKGSSGTGFIACESRCIIKDVFVRSSTSFNFNLYRDSSMNKLVYSYDKSGVGIMDSPDMLYTEDGSYGRIYYESDSGGSVNVYLTILSSGCNI